MIVFQPGTKNPQIALTITDLADLNHITKTELQPPQVLVNAG